MNRIVEYGALPNGVRVVHQQDNSPVAYCGFAINVGTRDELEHESGMAHFVEHLLFKGTEKRRSRHILNRLEEVGGELDAYTTKEETFVFATVLTADFERAMELCSDIVFHSVFPQSEIDKEVDVIIDEINSYNDSPSELIFDEFESIVFHNEQLGRSILGDAECLKNYRTDDALRFVKRNYKTDRILFFSKGNIPFKKVMAWSERYFGAFVNSGNGFLRSKPSLYVPKRLEVEKDTHQGHQIIGARAYCLTDDRRLPLHLLNNVLGGPCMNSRLSIALREKNGMAYNVESSYTAYSDSGIVMIYFGTDQRNMKKCETLVMKELKKLREQKMSDLQLFRAKKQLLGQLAISQENSESYTLNMAKSVLFFDRYESLEVVAERIEALTATDLINVANDVFAEDRLSVLTYV